MRKNIEARYDRLPLCHKCSNRQVQPDMLDERCTILTGCRRLTRSRWQRGLARHRGILWQKNCPVLGDHRREPCTSTATER